MPKIETTFKITQIVENGKSHLIISPAVKNEGFDPVQIEVTDFQWDALRFNFMIKTDYDKGETELNYIS